MIGPGTVEAVLDRLGLPGRLDADPGGLADLYRAWCGRVPFDNVRKLVALADAAGASGDPPPLPGAGATDFFDAWLTHGTGGTCWPSANALRALLVGCGFDAVRLAASMGDRGEPSHGTVVVRFGDDRHLVDSSMLTDVPVRLPAEGTATSGRGVFATRATAVPEGWLFAFGSAGEVTTLACRTITADPVDGAFFRERYEISRTWSPFNERVDLRTNRGRTVLSYSRGVRHRRSDAGLVSEPLSGDRLRAALIEEIGMSEEIVARLPPSAVSPASPVGPPPVSR